MNFSCRGGNTPTQDLLTRGLVSKSVPPHKGAGNKKPHHFGGVFIIYADLIS